MTSSLSDLHCNDLHCNDLHCNDLHSKDLHSKDLHSKDQKDVPLEVGRAALDRALSNAAD